MSRELEEALAAREAYIKAHRRKIDVNAPEWRRLDGKVRRLQIKNTNKKGRPKPHRRP